MTSIKKAARTGRRVVRDARTAQANAVSNGEMLQAAGDVIAARMEIMAAGAANPARVDLKEMALMSTEKVEALTASAASIQKNAADLGRRMADDAMAEAHHASRATAALASASTPAALAAVQFSYVTGWWGRTAGRMLTLNTELLRAQADALKPIRDKAMANAKRLKR